MALTDVQEYLKLLPVVKQTRFSIICGGDGVADTRWRKGSKLGE